MSEDLTLAEISTDVISNINTNFSQVEDAVNAKAEMNGDSTQRFNVADAVELTEAINKGQLDSIISAINSKLSAIEAKVDGMFTDGYRFPDYSRGESRTWDTTYTAECDGWLSVFAYDYSGVSNPTVTINGVAEVICATSDPGYSIQTKCIYPITKGDSYICSGSLASACALKFYPMKGAN